MKFLFLILFSLTAQAQSPWYFGIGEAVNLTNGTAYKNGVKTIAGSLNPSSTAVAAPAGSMYYSTSGTIYVKQDAGLSTNWLPLGIATTGALSTINGQSGPAVSIATGASGTDFNISAAANTISLNLPSSSASNRGLLASSDWTMFNAKEPAIAAGTTADYLRGDKTFQPVLGLPISTATQTALNLKADQSSLNTTNSNVTSLTTTVNGKIDGVASAVDSEVVLYSGTTGKVSKRATGTGYAKLTSGVLSASASVPTTDLTGVVPLANGGTSKALTAVNGGVVYTDADSQEVSAAGTSGQVLQSAGAGTPTWANKSISGKAQGLTAQTVEELQVPNKLLTLTAAGKYLHETGNTNILVDPSLEGSNLSTAWTLTAGTFTIDNTPIHGAINGLATLSAQSLALTQDSTSYATQFADGVQGLAYMWVRTSITSTPIYLCSRQAGTTSAVNTCATIVPNGKWALYKVPFVLGATSNGIALTSNAVSITGDIEWDDAFVGAVDLKQDVDQSRLSGESYFAGIAGCVWNRTSTALGAFTTAASCLGPTVTYSSMGAWQTTDTDLPRQTILNLPRGVYKAKFLVSSLMNTQAKTAFAINDGTTTCEAVGGNNSAINASAVVVECMFNYGSAGDRVFELFAATSANGITVDNSQASAPRVSTKFILEYFGSGQIYSSSCGANCVDRLTAKVSSSTTAGGVTKENIDWLNGNCTVSTGTTTCPVNAGVFTTLPNCSGVVTNVTAADRTIQYDDASSTTTSLVFKTVNNATLAALDFVVTCDKTGADFTASRTIVGSFKEVDTSPGVNTPKTCQYYFGGAAATLASPVMCTTGTCIEVYDSCGTGTPPSFASAGLYNNLTFAAGTFANSTPVSCECEAYNTSAVAPRKCVPWFDTGDSSWSSNSSGGYVGNFYSTSMTGTADSNYIQVTCKGQAP